MKKTKTAFTLIELLVVISIISLLIAILLPSLAKAREAGKAIKCMSNQKQLDLAFLNYSFSNQGYLPPYGNIGTFATSRWWTKLVGNYMDLPTDPLKKYGIDYMRCPSNGVTVGPFNRSYGVNYFKVFNYEGTSSGGTVFPSSMKLDDIPQGTMLSCDAVTIGTMSMAWWTPNVDMDGDGIKDSNSLFLANYNYVSPRHNGTAVFNFPDGSAHRVATKDFVTNVGGLWGPIN